MNENFGYGYGYAAPMPNLVQANIPEELAYQTQHENYLPFDAYLNSYSLNTYPENLEDTFSTAEPAQEQLLDFYAPGLDASLLAPSTSAQKFTDQPVLPESSNSLFPASANYELFNFGAAAQNTSNVQFNFDFSLDYASIRERYPLRINDGLQNAMQIFLLLLRHARLSIRLLSRSPMKNRPT